MGKAVLKKDGLIEQLNYEIEKLKKIEIQSSLQDNDGLDSNFHYEERIRVLNQEIEELKIENDNYANNEIVRLETLLQTQKSESLKTSQQMSYFEER